MPPRPGSGKTPKWLSFFGVGLAVCLIAAYDLPLMRALSQAPTPARTVADVGYVLGLGYVLIPLLLLLALAGYACSSERLQRAGLEAAAAFLAAGLLTQILKHLIGRPRPRLLGQAVQHFGPTLASGLDSFPSGHAASAVAVALVLSVRFPRLTPLFMLGAAVISASRLFSGSHFPVDVLGGVFLGVLAGLAVDRWWGERLPGGRRG
jgi:membrane-associated phospholipid phosphatase